MIYLLLEIMVPNSLTSTLATLNLRKWALPPLLLFTLFKLLPYILYILYRPFIHSSYIEYVGGLGCSMHIVKWSDHFQNPYLENSGVVLNLMRNKSEINC